VYAWEIFCQTGVYYSEAAGPHSDEDNDGYWDVRDGSATDNNGPLADLHTLYATGPLDTFREHGFDGVEGTGPGTGVLPVDFGAATALAPVKLSTDCSPLQTVYEKLLRDGRDAAGATLGNEVTLFHVGLHTKRLLQEQHTFMRLLPAGADDRGRPVLRVFFSRGLLPWVARSNALAQLLGGYAFPSLLSQKKADEWVGAGHKYPHPSVYLPAPHLRQLIELPFYQALQAQEEGGVRGRGLFATTSRNRALPLLPDWYRAHRSDATLVAAYLAFVATVEGASSPPQTAACIWHTAACFEDDLEGARCTRMLRSRIGLYAHTCKDRTRPGGDVALFYYLCGSSFGGGIRHRGRGMDQEIGAWHLFRR
jgi:hypothetical protein